MEEGIHWQRAIRITCAAARVNWIGIGWAAVSQDAEQAGGIELKKLVILDGCQPDEKALAYQ